MENGYSPADYAVMNGNDGFGMGGGGFLAWILLFALFGGNGFGFGGRGQAATTDELSAGFANSAVLNKLNELTAGQAGINQNLSNAICTSTYELASKIDACCCNTQLGVQQVRYDMAVQNGDLKSLIHSEAEATRAMIQQDKIESLQAQVNQLNLQAQLCGVVRYPTSMAYTAGYSPFCGYTNGCGCTNI